MKTHFTSYIVLLCALAGAFFLNAGCAGSVAQAETVEPGASAMPLPGYTPIEEGPLEFADAASARAWMSHSPDSAKYAGGILPQMATDALDYCTRLLNSAHDRFIVVDKDRMKVVLFDRYGRPEAEYGMACALNYGTKHRRSDMRTPEGFFTVKKIQDSTDWLYTDDNGVTSPKKGQYGPRFIRLDTPVTSSIGIHGTCAPWSIGKRRSHGCIRLRNDDLLDLAARVEPGMAVIVSPSRRDMAVNHREGYDVESVSTLPDHHNS